jgi:transposase
MDGKTKEALHARWVERMETAFHRMFEGKSQEELVTLTERENMAVAIGKELAAFLLEQHVAADPATAPAEASTTCCPKCGQPGSGVRQKGAKRREDLPQRTVRTRAGEIAIHRQRWKCARCRIVFFSVRRTSEVRHGRL